jgi:putative phosphoserine phosphatase / 1-acylglycerol-3-phosphate O-acyltransferase
VKTLQLLLDEIAASRRGAQVGAFLDLDGTLVSGYTAQAFYGARLRRGEIGPVELAQTLLAGVDGMIGGDPRRLVEIGITGLRGRSEDDLAELGERLFVQTIAGTIRPQARELVRAHRRMGHTLAIASAATRFQVAPIARDLGIEHVLCTELAAEHGILSGELVGDFLWGEPKARSVRAFAQQSGVDLRRSYAYANGDEDVPFLSTVGHPHAVNPQPSLERVAHAQSWPVVNLRDPPRADLRSLAGTLASIGAFNLGIGFGLGLGLLRGDRRFGLNLGGALGSDLALGLAGVRLNVVGEHNLWSARPAVFIFNHQSGLDPIVLGALLRRDFAAVGKREAAYDPRLLLISWALDVVFIDRSNTAQAKEDIKKLVVRLREGISAVVAPEGTRTPTPVLGRFKKGAFHVAMEAKVPLVPIVIRNAGELLWRGSLVIHPGTVDVCVLDPIPTDDWTLENLNERVEGVRGRYVETLEHWPGSSVR